MKNFFKYLIFDILIINIYLALSSTFIPYGGSSKFLYKSEILILLFLINIFRKTTEKTKLNFFIPYLYILPIYLTIDVYHRLLNRLPNYNDLFDVKHLIHHEPILAIGVWGLVAFFILTPFFLMKKASASWGNFLIRVISFLGLVGLVCSNLFYYYCTKNLFISRWNLFGMLKKNGRITSLLMNEKSMSINKSKLEEASENQHESSFFLKSARDQGINFYMVVLESYIDARVIPGLSQSDIKLISEELGEFDPDVFTSSTFAGGTAKTEFELLTGHPSLGIVNSVEFNVMNGQKISNWIEDLKDSQDYETDLISASTPGFYNSFLAYSSLGFEKQRYLKKTPQFINEPGGVYDGDLFDIFLKELPAKISNKEKLNIFYMIGMYGHRPFTRDLKKRPVLITNDNPEVQRAINQFIYRTREVKKFVKSVNELDSNACIIILSDHLPSIVGVNFKKKYENIGLIYFKGERKRLNVNYAYEVPYRLKEIIDGSKFQTFSKDDLENSYLKLLYESIYNK